MLSMPPDQLAAPVASIVAHKTQLGPGWVALGFALGVHAVLACLLLRGHPARPVAPPVQLVEVMLTVASVDAAAPPALPGAPPAPAPSDPAPPASDPEPKPAPPKRAESVPVPDAVPPPAAMVPKVAEPRADSAPASQQLPAPSLILPSPVRHAPLRPLTRRTARPAVRARKAEPDPDAAPSPASAALPAVSAPPSQAAPPVQQAPSPEAAGAWRSALAAWLQKHRTYPDAARRDDAEGRVVVRFTIDGAGLVTAVVLVGSSGSTVLDEAAQTLLRGAHLPPPPAPAPDHLSVTLPIRYTLEQ